MADLDALTAIIAPEAEAMGLSLVRVAFFGGESDPTLQVMAERPETRQLTIDDCADLSRRISGQLDALEEEKYLNSQEGQNELSECIIRALKKYISWLEEKQEDDKKEVKDDKITESDRKAAAANTKAFLEMVEANEKKKQAK